MEIYKRRFFIKKTVKMFCTLMISIGIVLTGCGNNADNSNVEDFTEMGQKSSNIFQNVPSLDNFDSYDFSGNALFLPISYETVNNGDYEETVFTEYVYVPDGTLWIKSYKALSGNRAADMQSKPDFLFDFEEELDFEAHGNTVALTLQTAQCSKYRIVFWETANSCVNCIAWKCMIILLRSIGSSNYNFIKNKS